MTLISISFISAILYLLAGTAQAMTLSGQRQFNPNLTLGLGAIAVLVHTYSVYLELHPGTGIQLSLFPVSSLITWLIGVLVVTSSLRKPLHNLFVFVFPLAAACQLLAAFAPNTAPAKDYNLGEVCHILSAILAYSIFTIAAIQAILLTIQDRQLKHHRTRGVVSALPPLQLMEKLLFESLWLGQALLTVSIITGLIFLDDIFAQHLVHKTVLSFIAWIIYAVILWGHWQRGWRGMSANRWTLSGFAVLMLAFFGSKLVVEVLL